LRPCKRAQEPIEFRLDEEFIFCRRAIASEADVLTPTVGPLRKRIPRVPVKVVLKFYSSA